MAKLFGFKLPESGEKKSKGIVSPVPPSEEDKSDFYVSSGFYGQYVDIEGVYKSEQDLVRRYREMCQILLISHCRKLCTTDSNCLKHSGDWTR